jgi:uncharacterized protein YndB with AHSA1/START domain
MKMHVDASSATDPVIVMARVFDAPRDIVWAAFTDPKHVVKWFGGHGFSSPVCEMDVRPGGIWRHVMRSPNGNDFTMEFVFIEVVKPEKLSWQHTDHGKRPPGGPPTVFNTVTFEDAGKKTNWKLVSRFSTTADRDFAVKMGHAEMISQGSEKLEELVKELGRQGGLL